MSGLYREIGDRKIGRGYNDNVAAIPINRFVGYKTSTASEDAVDTLSVTGVRGIKGVTQKAIAAAEVGDIYGEDGMVVVVESDGTGTIAIGKPLTVSAVADATEGRVKEAGTPATGVNVEIVAEALTAAAATAGAQLMARLRRYTLQGA